MFKIEKFTGGIAETNAYLFAAPEGAILIDAPEGVVEWLGEKGVRVGVLLLTHGHFDHVMDAAKLRREHGCPIVARQNVTADITLEALLDGVGMGPGVEPFEIDDLLGETPEISRLGQKFSVLQVPGHSPDSLCFLPETPAGEDERVLFAGDVLFRGSIGRTDFPHGDHSLLLDGIRTRLFPLGDEVVVYPGHGPATTIGEERQTNPFVGE